MAKPDPEKVDPTPTNTESPSFPETIPQIPSTSEPAAQVDENIVVWEEADNENPHRWSLTRKWTATVVLNILPLLVNLAPGILSGSGTAIREEYNVSSEVSILVTTMFMLGYTLGPLLFGPLSEYVGRKVPMLTGVVLFATFCLPIALAENFHTILICRFFSGIFGSASIAVTGGVVTDIWPDPIMRGIGIDIFILTGFLSPILGPLIGTFITESHLGWRWTMWIMAIVVYSFSILCCFVVPETYPPILLKRKARRLRLRTKQWALHSKVEETEVDLKSFAIIYLLRPWILMTTEPIYLIVTIYMGFVYGLVFLLFEGFPISFQEIRGWEPQIASLPFISLAIGVIVAFALIICYTMTIYKRQLKSSSGVLLPERRLPLMIAGGAILPPALFWAAWTSHASTPWPAQVVAYIPVGIGLFTIFSQGFKYILDVYVNVANSAIAGNAFVRSFFGAGFPLFAPAMYHNLGVQWATSVLAFIALGLAPVPVLFYIFGRKLRSYSKNALANV